MITLHRTCQYRKSRDRKIGIIANKKNTKIICIILFLLIDEKNIPLLYLSLSCKFMILLNDIK